MKNASLFLGHIGLLLFCSLSTLSATFSNSLFDQLVREDEVLEVTLTTDIEQFLLNKNTKTWQLAEMQYLNSNGEKQKWVIEIRPRGNYRRRVCDFPPIKLKFPKKKMKEMGLGKHNDLKLVSHCLAEEADDQLVMKEYLVYKMFERLSPQKFRVQLVKIHFIDAANLDRYDVRYGILIEDEDEMAERYEGIVCDDCYGMEDMAFDPHNQTTIQLFQYMIGNHDWSLRLNRNVKILNLETGRKNLAVPYDFDFAQLVNAPYAVQEPVYLPEQNPVFPEVGQQFLDKKEEITLLVDEVPLLTDKNKKIIQKHLKDFYASLKKSLASANTQGR